MLASRLTSYEMLLLSLQLSTFIAINPATLFPLPKESETHDYDMVASQLYLPQPDLPETL